MERLFSSSLVVVVSHTKPRQMNVYHFKKGTEICNYSYSSNILSIRLNRQVCGGKPSRLQSLCSLELKQRMTVSPDECLQTNHQILKGILTLRPSIRGALLKGSAP